MKQERNGLTRVTPITQHGTGDPALQRRIAERAYELFQLRGGCHGSDVQDWLTAEHEVLAGKHGRQSTPGRNHSTNGHSHPRSKTRKAA